MVTETSSYSISKLKRQSTIYRRHEKRMIKSYKNRDDPRSAPVRVLSGLIGFNLFITPYKGRGSSLQSETELSKSSNMKENVPLIDDSFEDSNIFKSFQQENNISEINDNNKEVAPVSNLPMVFFSGCVGGALEAVIGRSSTDELRRTSKQLSFLVRKVDPFHPKAVHPNLLFQSSANHAFSIGSSLSEISVSPIQDILSRASSISNERIIASSLSAGLLFSSNAYFRSVFCTERNQDLNSSHPLSSSHIKACCATGIVTGTVYSPVELIRSRLVMQQSAFSPYLRGLPQSSVLSKELIVSNIISTTKKHGILSLFKGGSQVYSREIFGNIIYFSTYELMKRTLQTTSDQRFTQGQPSKASTLQILLAGGSAGVAYWALVYPIDTLRAMLQAQSMSNPRFRTPLSVIHEIGIYPLYRGYLSCVMRAAPANAILFFGYENAFSMFVSKNRE